MLILSHGIASRLDAAWEALAAAWSGDAFLHKAVIRGFADADHLPRHAGRRRALETSAAAPPSIYMEVMEKEEEELCQAKLKVDEEEARKREAARHKPFVSSTTFINLWNALKFVGSL